MSVSLCSRRACASSATLAAPDVWGGGGGGGVAIHGIASVISTIHCVSASLHVAESRHEPALCLSWLIEKQALGV